MSFFRGIFGANEDGGGSSGSSTTMRREEDRSKMAGEPGSRVSLSQSSSVARAGNATTTPTTAGVAHFQRQKEHVDPAQTDGPRKKPKKSMAELDEELRAKMSGLAGDGGEAGVEYEDGQPVAMKRSVKNNMFRYI
ncbi:uncharacterized protein B0I36DRAFT_363868 [Microdochium trichocladiopsis]|uniref:Uncharacterized protein n=1 Tax=Microdochium trichocladiopsis TaxID=1682393 RepID=A0A9P9BPN9_9PEZI|nr:uncharacterized protein B0I36DRAFT_363868 [Microdochium trichocladiopsis]KAH7029305.1 hypothetical protein B0I36DRAFT_363868 [Microdochium trichocladiopsis]